MSEITDECEFSAMEMFLGRLLVLFVSILRIVICYAQDCEYRYTRQPPTVLSCNPYGSINRLALTCTVEGPNAPQFSIVWFRSTSNNGVEELPDSLPRIVIEVKMSSDIGGIAQFRRRASRFTLTELDQVNDIGEYWCQVKLENNGTVLKEKSNITVLYNEAHYLDQDLSQCDGSSFVDQRDCLHPQQITVPFDTDDNAQTDVMQPTSSPISDNIAEEPKESRKNLAALYAVIAVIAVFCIVIVTLTIIIVVLYRKKCGPVRFKTEDHKQTPNPYSGFTRERMNCNHSNVVAKTERSESRLTNSSQHQQQSFGSSPPPSSGATEEEPYSRLMRDHPTQIPGGVVEVFPGYSKLEIQETVPPLPPKPPSTKSKSRTPPPHTPLFHSPPAHMQRQSAIYSDLTDNDIERGVKSNHLLPHVNIYNTLDSNAEAPLSPDGHEYQELSPEGERYDYGEEFTEWRINHVTEPSKMSTHKSLFDDPEYSPLKGVCNKKDVAVVDPRYVGDYERSPTYTCPTVKIKASEVDPKYRGDYERDPTYVPKRSPRRASCSSVGAHRIPKPDEMKRRKSLEADALHKYTGDYEWSSNYVPAPLRNGSSGPLPALDRKYSGNYERDPVYVVHVLKKSGRGRHRAQSVEYTIPDTLSRENVAPPHIPHEYAQLEEDLKDPPREYARLNSQTPELT